MILIPSVIVDYIQNILSSFLYLLLASLIRNNKLKQVLVLVISGVITFELYHLMNTKIKLGQVEQI